MKFRAYWALALSMVIIGASGCAKKTDDAVVDNAAKTADVIPGNTITPAAPPAGATGPSAAPSTFGVNCGQGNVSGQYYQYYLSGAGTGTATSAYNGITADQRLRVSVEPQASGTNTNNNGAINYAKMAMKVELLKNGVSVATKYLPNTTTDSNGYRNGVNVGQKSDPAAADFSGMLSGGGKYSIRVSGIMTDYKCKNFCTTAVSCYNAQDPYCSYSGGWQYNWDYHSQNWTMCCGTLLYTCQQQQCGVGSAPSNSTWSMYVYVETDSTTCIPH